jgi:hypothetical protein
MSTVYSSLPSFGFVKPNPQSQSAFGNFQPTSLISEQRRSITANSEVSLDELLKGQLEESKVIIAAVLKIDTIIRD